MFIGEKVLQNVLQQAVTEMLTDDRLVPALFGSLEETEQASALQWLREHGSEITIQPSFPRQAPTLPVIAVLPGARSETDQTVGMIGAEGQDPENRFESRNGVYFSSGYRCMVLAQNAEVVTWVSAFVLFTMVRYREYFTERGLILQNITMSDFNVAEEFLPEFVFTRVVTLSGNDFIDFPVTLPPPPTAISIDATYAGGLESSVTGMAVTDTFTRADALSLNLTDTGQQWSALAGTWGILSNKAYVPSSGGADRDAAVVECGAANVKVSAMLSTIATGQRLVFRASGFDDFLAIDVAANYRLRKRVAGVWSTVATFGTTTPANGDTVMVLLDGWHIRFYLNGTFVAEVSEAFNQTATKHGLGVGTGAGAARFSRFEVN